MAHLKLPVVSSRRERLRNPAGEKPRMTVTDDGYTAGDGSSTLEGRTRLDALGLSPAHAGGSQQMSSNKCFAVSPDLVEGASLRSPGAGLCTSPRVIAYLRRTLCGCLLPTAHRDTQRTAQARQQVETSHKSTPYTTVCRAAQQGVSARQMDGHWAVGVWRAVLTYATGAPGVDTFGLGRAVCLLGCRSRMRRVGPCARAASPGCARCSLTLRAASFPETPPASSRY
ncbi:hypothetical protein P171DRAFT_242533 [Karstenula rhodostoma CBS 690.94]|uniref:Uncharacterized protein n=1 Tax=Karstenula rhodostoma CBS 690.94 TaxID=1392251 RepID=A0A9P4PPF6_9PLEO|nr:hypothetical protein P171DRAFT_242533 [Karstenula rhodostoma CBS 690.94]